MSADLDASNAQRHLIGALDSLSAQLSEAHKTVRELKQENDFLADRVDGLRRNIGGLIRECDEWEANAESAQRERDELAEKLKVKTTYVTNTVTTEIPRVITADELMPDMHIAWIAIRCLDTYQYWQTGTVLETMGKAFRIREVDYGRAEVEGEWEIARIIVLLPDAPMSAPRTPRNQKGRNR